MHAEIGNAPCSETHGKYKEVSVLTPVRKVAEDFVDGVLDSALTETDMEPVWPKNMHRILPGDELIGIGGKLFPTKMNHKQWMQMIANSPFPLELMFRKVYT